MPPKKHNRKHVLLHKKIIQKNHPCKKMGDAKERNANKNTVLQYS